MKEYTITLNENEISFIKNVLTDNIKRLTQDYYFYIQSHNYEGIKSYMYITSKSEALLTKLEHEEQL